jgi:hypothetical protein
MWTGSLPCEAQNDDRNPVLLRRLLRPHRSHCGREQQTNRKIASPHRITLPPEGGRALSRLVVSPRPPKVHPLSKRRAAPAHSIAERPTVPQPFGTVAGPVSADHKG